MLKPIAIVSGLVLVVAGMTAAFLAPPQTWKDKVSIESRAHKAKAEGKTTLTLLPPVVEYADMGLDLTQVLAKHSVVTAELVEANSYLGDINVIRTAYKFRVIEPISRKNEAFCESCPQLKDLSAKVSPILSNEFVLDVSGGTVNIDGVTVIMGNNDGLQFEKQKRYLLFLSMAPSGMAALGVGPSGVFSLDDDDTLESVNKSTALVPSQIATRFANKLTKLKQAAQRN